MNDSAKYQAIAALAADQIDPADGAFWSRCAVRTLQFSVCELCNRFHHPPMPLCPYCQSDRLDWRPPVGDPRLFAFSVIQHAMHPGVVALVPYVIAVVEYPDADGVKLASNIIDPVPELTIGQPLELVWTPGPRGVSLPHFRTR